MCIAKMLKRNPAMRDALQARKAAESPSEAVRRPTVLDGATTPTPNRRALQTGSYSDPRRL